MNCFREVVMEDPSVGGLPDLLKSLKKDKKIMELEIARPHTNMNSSQRKQAIVFAHKVM